jgi:ketosteroid isomerase-like protein
MKSIALALGVGCGLFLCAATVVAQQGKEEPENPAHEELRELKKKLVDAIGKADVDAMMAQLSPDVVVTWLNGEQSRGTKQVREYYERMMKGDKPVVKSFTMEDVNVKEKTQLYGDNSGMAYGTAKSHFVLTDGRDFTIEGPWTALLEKKGGKWQVAALHTSANMFDNPILGIVTKWMTWAAVGAGVVGLLVGLVVMSMLKRRPKTQPL